MTTKLTLQKILKGILHAEENKRKPTGKMQARLGPTNQVD
jgi:hypothetical protein